MEKVIIIIDVEHVHRITKETVTLYQMSDHIAINLKILSKFIYKYISKSQYILIINSNREVVPCKKCCTEAKYVVVNGKCY